LTGPHHRQPPCGATFFKEAAKKGTRILVVDPRRPDIANFASWYCQINPGTDVAFYNAVMNVLIAEDRINHSFIAERTEQFDALREVVQAYPPERVEGICGVAAATIREVARAIGGAGG